MDNTQVDKFAEDIVYTKLSHHNKLLLSKTCTKLQTDLALIDKMLKVLEHAFRDQRR